MMLDQEGSSSSVASLGHSPVQSQKQRRGADYTSVPVLERTLDDDEEADSSIIEDYDNDSLALEPQGTLFSSYLNITNTILGTGMLAMPSALAGVGFGLGIFLIFLSGFASSFGLFLLTQVAAKVGRNSSFFTCSKLTYPSGAVFFDLAIAIKCFGVSVSYLVICGGLLPQVVQGFYPDIDPSSALLTKGFWVTFCILIISPFALARSLSALRHVSGFALLAVVYLVIVVTYFFFFGEGEEFTRPSFSEIRWIHFDAHFFSYMPIFVFAFTCHQNIFAVYNELQDNSQAQIQKVISLSVGSALSVYQVIGILGYLTFGQQVFSNVIAQYPHSMFVTGGQLAIALLVLLSYPLQCHPCRFSLDKVLSCGSNTRLPMSKKNHVAITLGILVASFLMAISINNLSTILSLVGATGSTTICYILPGLFYFKFRENTDVPGRPWDAKKIGSLVLAGMGVIVMSTSLTSQIYAMLSGRKAPGGH